MLYSENSWPIARPDIHQWCKAMFFKHLTHHHTNPVSDYPPQQAIVFFYSELHTNCYVGIVRQMTTGKLGQKGHLADGSGQVMCSAKSIEQIHHSPLAHRQRSMWALFRKFSLSRKNLGGWQNARGRHLLVVFNGPCLLVW